MMNKNIIGYLIAGLGLVGMVSSVIFKDIQKTILLYPSIALVIIGIVFIVATSKSGTKTKHQEQEEVPIYKGKEIIGYRVKE